MPLILVARNEIPRNIITEIAPIVAKVCWAFRDWGRRNAGMAFEMASTPVSAVAPEEKACRITKRLNGAAVFAKLAIGCTCWPNAVGHPPTHFASPMTIVARIAAMNAYVGSAKIAPVSRTPRRFTTVRSTRAPTTATTPATTETATVRM